MADSVKALLTKAINAGKKRDYKKAIKILEELVAHGYAEIESPFNSGKKSYPEIYLYLSRSWAAEKNYNKASAYGHAYVKRVPNEPSGWFFLGRTYILAEEFNKAVFCLEKSASLAPQSVEIKAMLGMAYLKWKKTSLARQVFEDALKYAPKSERLNTGYLNALFIEAVHEFRNGDVNLAGQMFDFVIKNKVDGVAPRLYLAHSLKMQNRLEEALVQYEEAARLAPEDKALAWYPAMIKMELGDHAGATEAIAKLDIELPNDGVTEQFFMLQAAKKHLETKDYKKAAQTARIYIRSFGSSEEVRLIAAEAQRAMGNINRALNHYKCALKENPQSPYPHYGMMLALQEAYRWQELSSEVLRAEAAGSLDEEDIYYYKIITAAHIDNPAEEVLPHLQALIQQGKADSAIFNSMGTCYIKLNMPELAINWYQKALDMNPKNEEAQIGLIAAYESQKDDKATKKSYLAYLDDWSNNMPIRRDFVLFLRETKEWEEAGDQLEVLIGQSHNRNFEPELARLRRKAGQYQKSAILYRKLLLAKPKEPIFLHNLVYCLDKMGKTKIALDLLQAARKSFGLKTETYFIEGILQMHLKKKDDAIRIFQYIIEKDPKNIIAKNFLEKVTKGRKAATSKTTATKAKSTKAKTSAKKSTASSAKTKASTTKKTTAKKSSTSTKAKTKTTKTKTTK